MRKGGDYPIGVERENRERKIWMGTEVTVIILDIAQGFQISNILLQESHLKVVR